jgi:hypothetical protein
MILYSIGNTPLLVGRGFVYEALTSIGKDCRRIGQNTIGAYLV